MEHLWWIGSYLRLGMFIDRNHVYRLNDELRFKLFLADLGSLSKSVNAAGADLGALGAEVPRQ